jgi:type IV pilus assembly protein PilE
MKAKRFGKGLRKLKAAGFTLIELVIVVAIIGILAAIAYPSYQDSVRKSRRADAKAALLELAHFMERNYTAANRYDKDASGSDINTAAFPYTQTPREGTSKSYDLSLSAVAQNSFTLSATPISGSGQTADPCKTLSLASTGAKSVSNNATLSATECWK